MAYVKGNIRPPFKPNQQNFIRQQLRQQARERKEAEEKAQTQHILQTDIPVILELCRNFPNIRSEIIDFYASAVISEIEKLATVKCPLCSFVNFSCHWQTQHLVPNNMSDAHGETCQWSLTKSTKQFLADAYENVILDQLVESNLSSQLERELETIKATTFTITYLAKTLWENEIKEQAIKKSYKIEKYKYHNFQDSWPLTSTLTWENFLSEPSQIQKWVNKSDPTFGLTNEEEECSKTELPPELEQYFDQSCMK